MPTATHEVDSTYDLLNCLWSSPESRQPIGLHHFCIFCLKGTSPLLSLSLEYCARLSIQISAMRLITGFPISVCVET